ncbi:unnamed protein product, partial [Discosporangium mesarthrocarpum]
MDALKGREALAKELYRRLFDWIVHKVNRSIECEGDGLTMGVLDIYGFEIFETNHFEQFCINYVNEKLQQYFIEHTIRAEQEDYEDEGLEWVHVDFFNNQCVCDMIEGRAGLLSLLDEVSSHRDNNELVLVNHYNRAMSKHRHYFFGQEAVYGTRPGRVRTTSAIHLPAGDGGRLGSQEKSLSPVKSRNGRSRSFGDLHSGSGRGVKSTTPSYGTRMDKDANRMFGVRHFAGDVAYVADGFIEKNADRLHRDLADLLAKSKNPLASTLFQPGVGNPDG